MLVDGYNVIRAGHLYEHLTGQSPDHAHDAFNAAREALLSDVVNLAGREFKATVVFDGAGNPGSVGERQSFGPIEYLFSPHGVSADSVIEELANKAAHEGHEVVVVTSDATLQWTVLGHRVVRMSAANFSDEVRDLRESLEPDTLPSTLDTSRKFTLGQRLDPEVLRQLERFVQGEE